MAKQHIRKAQGTHRDIAFCDKYVPAHRADFSPLRMEADYCRHCVRNAKRKGIEIGKVRTNPARDLYRESLTAMREGTYIKKISGEDASGGMAGKGEEGATLTGHAASTVVEGRHSHYSARKGLPVTHIHKTGGNEHFHKGRKAVYTEANNWDSTKADDSKRKCFICGKATKHSHDEVKEVSPSERKELDPGWHNEYAAAKKAARKIENELDDSGSRKIWRSTTKIEAERLSKLAELQEEIRNLWEYRPMLPLRSGEGGASGADYEAYVRYRGEPPKTESQDPSAPSAKTLRLARLMRAKVEQKKARKAQPRSSGLRKSGIGSLPGVVVRRR